MALQHCCQAPQWAAALLQRCTALARLKVPMFASVGACVQVGTDYRYSTPGTHSSLSRVSDSSVITVNHGTLGGGGLPGKRASQEFKRLDHRCTITLEHSQHQSHTSRFSPSPPRGPLLLLFITPMCSAAAAAAADCSCCSCCHAPPHCILKPTTRCLHPAHPPPPYRPPAPWPTPRGGPPSLKMSRSILMTAKTGHCRRRIRRRRRRYRLQSTRQML